MFLFGKLVLKIYIRIDFVDFQDWERKKFDWILFPFFLSLNFMIAPSLFKVETEVYALSHSVRQACALEENFFVERGLFVRRNLQWNPRCACAIPSNMEKLIESGDDDRAQCTKLFLCTHTHTRIQVKQRGKWNGAKAKQQWKNGIWKMTVSKSFGIVKSNFEWQPRNVPCTFWLYSSRFSMPFQMYRFIHCFYSFIPAITHFDCMKFSKERHDFPYQMSYLCA